MFSMAVVAALLMLAAACKKKETTISDYPSLTITAPAATGGMYNTGDTIHIMGTATASGTDDAHLLHELSLTMKNTANNAVVWTAVIGVHDLETYTINTTVIAPAAGNYALYDSVVNHLEKYATQTQTFMVM